MNKLHTDASQAQLRLQSSTVFRFDGDYTTGQVLSNWKAVQTSTTDMTQAAILAGAGDYAASANLLDSIRIAYKFESYEEVDLIRTGDLYTFIGQMAAQGKAIPQYNTAEVNTLRGYAEAPEGGIAAQKAQNALCFHHGICYDPATGTPKSAAPQKPRTYATEKEILSKLNTVSAYPNPAIDYTTIAYQLLYARENTSLRIFDGTGRLIESRNLGQNYEGQQLIDTRKYANGLYVYEVIQDGRQVSADKFVINR